LWKKIFKFTPKNSNFPWGDCIFSCECGKHATYFCMSHDHFSHSPSCCCFGPQP
jgi:hypothetical protein